MCVHVCPNESPLSCTCVCEQAEETVAQERRKNEEMALEHSKKYGTPQPQNAMPVVMPAPLPHTHTHCAHCVRQDRNAGNQVPQ